MEIRLDDVTVTSIPINIEGRPTLAFSLDDETFTDGFHNLLTEVDPVVDSLLSAYHPSNDGTSLTSKR